MSMQETGISEYAFLFTDETLRLIAKKLFSDYTDEKYNKAMGLYVYDIKEKLSLNYEGEFTGSTYPLKEDGCPDFFSEDNYSSNILLYLPLEKEISLFKTSYKNMEEVVSEIRNKIGDYLPDDYNYRKNICLICGTYYG